MEIITSTADLVVGDVLYVSKLVQPRNGGEEYWWRAYWIVESVVNSRIADLMLLKLNPDPVKDHRAFGFGEETSQQVIQYLHPDDYPPGVVSMRLKHIHLGTIKLGGE